MNSNFIELMKLSNPARKSTLHIPYPRTFPHSYNRPANFIILPVHSRHMHKAKWRKRQSRASEKGERTNLMGETSRVFLQPRGTGNLTKAILPAVDGIYESSHSHFFFSLSRTRVAFFSLSLHSHERECKGINKNVIVIQYRMGVVHFFSRLPDESASLSLSLKLEVAILE